MESIFNVFTKNTLHIEAIKLLKRFQDLNNKPLGERTVSDILGLEIDYAILTAKYANFFECIGRTFNKNTLRIEEKDLADIEAVRAYTYRLTDLKIGNFDFDGLLDEIAQVGANGEYFTNNNLDLYKKSMICNTMSAVYSIVVDHESIDASFYSKIKREHSVYNCCCDRQFKTRIDRLVSFIEKNTYFGDLFGSMFDQNPTPKTYGIIRK